MFVRPSGTVTFLYTDIEGSTQLARLHPEDMPPALARHHAILQDAITTHNGYIFRVVGDEFNVAFANAFDALSAALQAQRGLHIEVWGATVPLRVRMGLHTGPATARTDDYDGYLTLSHTKRLMSTAYGGQILISEATQALVRDQLPQGVTLRDLGEHRLKDFDRAEHIFQVVVPDLPTEFPPLKTLGTIRNNLPMPLTSFIGRERELAEVKQLLSNTRLLTLTGPGGTGKTRLALQLAAGMLEIFTEGVWLVELAPLADPTLVTQTVAATLGLREQPGRTLVDALTDYVRTKNLLLLLDNCEHLIEACAQLANTLLQAAARLKILASSREPLGIAGETAYRVPSLPLPDMEAARLDALPENDCVRLFVDRALTAYTHFRLNAKNAPAIAQICQRLDGIPLAIELAAARVAIFSPEQIAARLDDRFRLLTGGSRAALERHQTLRALIDWSYGLLSEQEQRLFRQLAVFAGGWTFEAAQAVCAELDILTVLTELVNKSVVMVDEPGGGARFRLLETMRQYARDKLLEAGESEEVRNRHLDFFLQFAENAEVHFNRHQELEWMLRLETDYGNLRAALEWAMESNLEAALRLGGTLALFWLRRGRAAEGRQRLTEVLARSHMILEEDSKRTNRMLSIRAKALMGSGLLDVDLGEILSARAAFEECATLCRQIADKRMLSQVLAFIAIGKGFLGDPEAAYTTGHESLTLARQSGDKLSLAMALTNMAAVLYQQRRDLETARAYGEEGRRLFGELGSHWYLAMTSFGLGLYGASQGNYTEARSLLETGLPLFVEMGDRHRVNMVRSELAHLERREGYFVQAKSLYRETILEWQKLGHRSAVVHQLECFAMIARGQAENERAARLFGAAESLRETINTPMRPNERVEYDRQVSDLRSSMDHAAFTSAWAEGRAMTMEQAIALATEKGG